MLYLSYDEDNIYSLKIAETVKVKSYSDNNIFRLENIKSNDEGLQ